MEYAHAAQNARAEHTPLPACTLADLDLGLFSCARPLPLACSHTDSDSAICAGSLPVLIGTGIAGCRGSCPASEPRPYILRFDEDKPNPLYRRVCYTFAWNAVISFALLNERPGDRCLYRQWHMKEIYTYAYSAALRAHSAAWRLGKLPRVGPSTKDEGTERRYFYGSVWAVTVAQTMLLVVWKILPQTQGTSLIKLVVFVGALCSMGVAT